MTNLGEAKCAREAEIAYATMAMVTDYDCWKADEAHVTVEMIVANLMKNAAMAKAIIAAGSPQIPVRTPLALPRCPARAIMTDKEPLAGQDQAGARVDPEEVPLRVRGRGCITHRSATAALL